MPKFSCISLHFQLVFPCNVFWRNSVHNFVILTCMQNCTHISSEIVHNWCIFSWNDENFLRIFLSFLEFFRIFAYFLEFSPNYLHIFFSYFPQFLRIFLFCLSFSYAFLGNLPYATRIWLCNSNKMDRMCILLCILQMYEC